MLRIFLDIFDSETRVKVTFIHLRVICNNCGVPGMKKDYSSRACNDSMELVSVVSNCGTNLKWK